MRDVVYRPCVESSGLKCGHLCAPHAGWPDDESHHEDKHRPLFFGEGKQANVILQAADALRRPKVVRFTADLVHGSHGVDELGIVPLPVFAQKLCVRDQSVEAVVDGGHRGSDELLFTMTER